MCFEISPSVHFFTAPFVLIRNINDLVLFPFDTVKCFLRAAIDRVFPNLLLVVHFLVRRALPSDY